MIDLNDPRLQTAMQGIRSLNPLGFKYADELYPFEVSGTPTVFSGLYDYRNSITNPINSVFDYGEKLAEERFDNEFIEGTDVAPYGYATQEPGSPPMNPFNLQSQLGLNLAKLRAAGIDTTDQEAIDKLTEQQLLDIANPPNTQNLGIMQQAPTIPMGIFTDDAGLEEEFPEVKQEPRGIAKLFEVLGNIPTPFNLARRGLESLQGFNQRLRNTDFGRSATLKDYFQARRDRKAREEAAARGAAKASERAMERSVQESGRGFGGDTSGQRAGGGGFGGNNAGGFSEADPSATEGSF